MVNVQNDDIEGRSDKYTKYRYRELVRLGSDKSEI